MPGFVNPLAPLWEVIRHIAQSEFVVASSLHGIIVAEALGVPVRPLGSRAEALAQVRRLRARNRPRISWDRRP